MLKWPCPYAEVAGLPGQQTQMEQIDYHPAPGGGKRWMTVGLFGLVQMQQLKNIQAMIKPSKAFNTNSYTSHDASAAIEHGWDGHWHAVSTWTTEGLGHRPLGTQLPAVLAHKDAGAIIPG